MYIINYSHTVKQQLNTTRIENFKVAKHFANTMKQLGLLISFKEKNCETGEYTYIKL